MESWLPGLLPIAGRWECIYYTKHFSRTLSTHRLNYFPKIFNFFMHQYVSVRGVTCGLLHVLRPRGRMIVLNESYVHALSLYGI